MDPETRNRSKYCIYHSVRVYANPLSPFAETVAVPFQISLVIPARVRTPKDKPNAEGTVGMISTWITAALRDEQFFSLAGLNRAIREKLELFNHKLFQKKEGSRISLFLEEEKPFLTW